MCVTWVVLGKPIRGNSMSQYQQVFVHSMSVTDAGYRLMMHLITLSYNKRNRKLDFSIDFPYYNMHVSAYPEMSTGQDLFHIYNLDEYSKNLSLFIMQSQLSIRIPYKQLLTLHVSAVNKACIRFFFLAISHM